MNSWSLFVAEDCRPWPSIHTNRLCLPVQVSEGGREDPDGAATLIFSCVQGFFTEKRRCATSRLLCCCALHVYYIAVLLPLLLLQRCCAAVALCYCKRLVTLLCCCNAVLLQRLVALRYCCAAASAARTGHDHLPVPLSYLNSVLVVCWSIS